jgi:hypothetical protein
MKSGQLGISAVGLFLFLTFCGGAQAQQQELPSYLQDAQHRAVLQKWLKEESNLRLATDADCGQCEQEIANQRRLSGADYHPYYVVGDFNGDGKKDFAVAAIEIEADAEGRANQRFVVAVFNAPFTRRKPEPAYEKDALVLRDGGLFFGPPRLKPYRLFVGLFGSDQGLTLVPKGKKYVAQ